MVETTVNIAPATRLSSQGTSLRRVLYCVSSVPSHGSVFPALGNSTCSALQVLVTPAPDGSMVALDQFVLAIEGNYLDTEFQLQLKHLPAIRGAHGYRFRVLLKQSIH